MVNHPDLYIDFKRVFSLRMEYLYDRIGKGEVTLAGTIATPWVEEVSDRFTFFVGRVALPDPD